MSHSSRRSSAALLGFEADFEAEDEEEDEEALAFLGSGLSDGMLRKWTGQRNDNPTTDYLIETSQCMQHQQGTIIKGMARGSYGRPRRLRRGEILSAHCSVMAFRRGLHTSWWFNATTVVIHSSCAHVQYCTNKGCAHRCDL